MATQQERETCAQCNGKLRCVNSRPRYASVRPGPGAREIVKKGYYRLRRYECVDCKARVSTVEVPLEKALDPEDNHNSVVSRVLQYFVKQAPTITLLTEVELRARDVR